MALPNLGHSTDTAQAQELTRTDTEWMLKNNNIYGLG